MKTVDFSETIEAYDLKDCRYRQLNDFMKVLLGNPKPKKMIIFRFVGIFEYIILLILILFLDMCTNSYGWMPSL